MTYFSFSAWIRTSNSAADLRAAMVLHDQMPKTLKGETRMKIFEAIRAEAEARWAEVKEMQQTGEGYDE